VRIGRSCGFLRGGGRSAGFAACRRRWRGGCRAVAFLIFLAAAARARIVAADFLFADNLLGFLGGARADHLHLCLLAPFAPLVLPDHFLFFFRRAHQEEVTEGFVLDAVHHGFKHVKGLALVLHQRIALAVAAQPDALFQVVDTQWKDHLLAMDHLKEGIGLRGYSQRDPLVEYKRESFQIFEEMMDRIEDETLRYLFLMRTPEEEEEMIRQYQRRKRREQAQMQMIGAGATEKPQQVIRRERIGRNDPCPCGSGKKYKKCHGAIKSSPATGGPPSTKPADSNRPRPSDAT